MPSSSFTSRLRPLHVAAYLALTLVPLFAMITGLRGPRFYGVLEEVAPPRLSLGAMRAERFQRTTDAWFQHHLGLRSFSIAFDGGLLYHLFGEAKHGSTVFVGEDDTLFIADDLNYFNKHGGDVTGATYLHELAGKLAALQRALARRGKALVPVLVPSKTSIYRDKVPRQWTAELGEPRPTDVETYHGALLAFAAHGLRFVDARALLTTRPEWRHLLFGPQGRHWTRYGACLVLAEVATQYAQLTGATRPPHDCQLKMEPVVRSTSDLDLLALMNALFTRPTYVASPISHYDPAPPGPRPRLAVIATSFGWQLMEQAEHSGRWGEIHLNYYNNTIYSAGDGSSRPLEVGSPLWRAATLDKDVYVLDLFEVYLMKGAYVDRFLEDASAALLGEGEPPP